MPRVPPVCSSSTRGSGRAISTIGTCPCCCWTTPPAPGVTATGDRTSGTALRPLLRPALPEGSGEPTACSRYKLRQFKAVSAVLVASASAAGGRWAAWWWLRCRAAGRSNLAVRPRCCCLASLWLTAAAGSSQACDRNVSWRAGGRHTACPAAPQCLFRLAAATSAVCWPWVRALSGKRRGNMPRDAEAGFIWGPPQHCQLAGSIVDYQLSQAHITGGSHAGFAAKHVGPCYLDAEKAGHWARMPAFSVGPSLWTRSHHPWPGPGSAVGSDASY